MRKLKKLLLGSFKIGGGGAKMMGKKSYGK